MFPAMAAGFPGLPNTTLPAMLADGQSAFSYISYREIGEVLIHSGRTRKIKLVPVCEDSAGGAYRGKPWEVDPAEVSRM